MRNSTINKHNLSSVRILEEIRKVSRDCYASYRGNRYSVPWKYAGRECRIIEESALVKIEIDSSIVAEHSLIPGTGRISRKKEHFEGLLKAIRDQNIENSGQGWRSVIHRNTRRSSNGSVRKSASESSHLGTGHH